MVSHLFFYQLTPIALVWLCVMLQWVWPSDPTAVCPTTPEPTPPVPKRHRERTPYAGLTTKPPCDACAHASDLRPAAPCPPPPRIVPTRGRRRQVDTSTHFCPNPDCAYRGWVGWGNLRANGHPSGGPWRQLLCGVCRGYFLETLGTIFHGKRASVAKSISPCRSRLLIEFRPLISVPVLPEVRSEEEAIAFLAAFKARTDGHAPLFTSEKLPAYVAALIANDSTPEPSPAQRGRGRPRQTPRRVVDMALLYAQVDKRREQGRVVEVRRRIIFGARDIITEVLGGQQINTAYVERDNLTSRQTNGRLVRKTLSHSKKSYFLRRHLELEDAVLNFVRP